MTRWEEYQRDVVKEAIMRVSRVGSILSWPPPGTTVEFDDCPGNVSYVWLKLPDGDQVVMPVNDILYSEQFCRDLYGEATYMKHMLAMSNADNTIRYLGEYLGMKESA